MPPHEGILDHRDWEEVKQNWEVKTTWQPRWKASTKARPLARLGRALRFIFIGPERTAGLDASRRRTAWLDGLRGFAALVVYWHHHILWAHPWQQPVLEGGFGAAGGPRALAALPFVRNFVTGGHFAVAVFFAISGYALSARPLALARPGGDRASLADGLASALFRRWPRLFLPLAATTLAYALARHAFGGVWAAGFKPAGSWADEAREWYYEFKNFSFVYNAGGEPWFSYNVHAWSIPVEFRGSVVVYTALLAFSRCSRNARLWCEAGLAFYFLYIADGWFCALFVTGMLLCDLDMLAVEGDLPRLFTRLEPAKTFIYYHLLALGLYLGGVPSLTLDVKDLAKSRGWYYLSLLKPQAVYDYKWFYLFWAATLLVASVPRIRWLKSFFEARFCQHLGRVSYSLYLVHGPVLWTLGTRMYAAVGFVTPEHQEHVPKWVNAFPLSHKGPLGLEFAFLVPHVVLLPLTMWLAEAVTRLVDEPSVRFAQWLYRRTLGRQLSS
jgi:peptidoglycan/LPS O-acetylase OafA/YrhL